MSAMSHISRYQGLDHDKFDWLNGALITSAAGGLSSEEDVSDDIFWHLNQFGLGGEADMAAEPLSLRHRRVLKLLANAPHGRADGKIIARFTDEFIELIAAGLVEVHAKTAKEHGRAIQTVSVRITAAGRRAIEG